MQKEEPIYRAYVEILKEELLPAMGCTEPVALAFAAAKAREVLGCAPDRALVQASRNIIKNVKSVVVPNTGGLKGIQASVAAGIIAGNADKGLQAIAEITADKQILIASFLEKTPIEVEMLETRRVLEILITLYCADSQACVQITDTHTNIARIEKDGKIIFSKEEDTETAKKTDRGLLETARIFEFANAVAIDDVREMIERQITHNSAISAEGLAADYGANIGKVLREIHGDDIRTRAKAAAAAGSDARMSGCNMPVVIIAGSGNQGMTASLPVIEYALHLNKSREDLIRALALADLLAVHMKTGVGRLSAYCGVVCAGAAAGAGIAYLRGGRLKEISGAITNALAITSGIVCDGAKPSCAAKIAAAVDAGILGCEMAMRGSQFAPGEGLVAGDVEGTIANVGKLARDGMRETDKEITSIMLAH
ncbi:MAG: L-serine ammonia-lyase, iron-sulfur-dependent, subunit alpha [Treponema sp.]|nr:L-serine ammonia-lyase, iron-sulfur-dependent, subunit alpha [Treponema sp.]